MGRAFGSKPQCFPANGSLQVNNANACISGILTDATVVINGEQELISSVILEFVYTRAMRPAPEILTQGALVKGTMPHVYRRVETALSDLGFIHKPKSISDFAAEWLVS